MTLQTQRHPAMRIFLSVCVFNFLGYGLIVNCFGVLLAPMSQGLGISVTHVSLTHSVRTICGTIGSIFAGRLMARIRFRRYLSAVCLLIGASALACARCTTLPQLLLASAVMGFAIGLGIYTLVPLVIGQWFAQPGGYLGIATACGGAGGIVFSPLLSWVVQRFSWQAGYQAIAAVALLCLLPIGACLIRFSPKELGLQPYGEKQAQAQEVAASTSNVTLREMLTTPQVYVCVLFFIASGLIAGIYTHVPGMLQSKGYDGMSASYLNSLYQLGSTGAQCLIGVLSVRLGFRKTMRGYLLLVLCGVVGVACLGGQLLFAALSLLLLGAGRAVGVVAGPILVRNFFGAQRYSSVFSNTYSCYLATVAASTTIYGAIYDCSGSYTGALLAMSLCLAVVFGIASLAPNRAPN